MFSLKKDVLKIIVFLFSISIHAQSSTNFGVFPTIDHSGKISQKFDYSLYYFGAFNLTSSESNANVNPAKFFALYLEQAVTFNYNPKLSFTVSYVFEKQYPTEDYFRNENRFYLQSTFKQRYNKTEFKHRLRFDGRFIEDKITNSAPFTSRLRYLFGIKTPIINNDYYFSAYNEFFFNLDKKSATVYAENWAYSGFGLKLDKNNALEIGPLYIFWVNNSKYDLTNFGYLQFSWINNLDFTSKK